METSLHRQLKEVYAGTTGKTEVSYGDFRIDVVNRGRLIEIQHGSLAAIRRKIRKLCGDYKVTVVKPIVASKKLVKRPAKNKPVSNSRMSPKRCGVLDVFHELVYFRDVFPHPNLRIEVPLVHIEEWRYPGHGKRRRRRENDFLVEDQMLIDIEATHRFRTNADLMRLIPRSLINPFTTQHLAEVLEIDRTFAQRIAYCLREMKAIDQIGKQGNAWLYRDRRRAA
jgi:hypothetical protein